MTVLKFSALGVRPAIVGRVPSRGVPVRVNVSAPSMVPGAQAAIVPTFRLDGGTIPHRGWPFRFQKPQCFAWLPWRKSPEKGIVPFDRENFTPAPMASREQRPTSGPPQRFNISTLQRINNFFVWASVAAPLAWSNAPPLDRFNISTFQRFNGFSHSAASTAAYVIMISAPARRRDRRVSRVTARSSIQPFAAAALIIAYSALTAYAAVG